MWPCVSICVGIPECLNMNKAKQPGEGTCSGARSVCGTAEEDAETCHGAVAGGQKLTGSIAVSAAGPA